MVDKKVNVRECDTPKCPTPTDDVRRIESTVEGEGTVLIDACAGCRAPVMELRKHAHKRLSRRRGIKVVNPTDIRRGE